MFGLGLITRVLAVIGIIAIIAVVIVYFPSVLPFAQTEWSKIQPPRCATAADCVLANNSCCSNQSGNWSCAALDAHCAPNYEARVSGCWCGNGVCAANYSCEPLHPTATVELPPFPPEDLEVSPSPSPAAQIANPASVYCVEHGGTFVIVDLRTPPFGQAGYCLFGEFGVVGAGECTQSASYNGCVSACEEWKFFRGECKPDDCNLTCIAIGSRSEGWRDCHDVFITYANCAPK